MSKMMTRKEYDALLNSIEQLKKMQRDMMRIYSSEKNGDTHMLDAKGLQKLIRDFKWLDKELGKMMAVKSRVEIYF